jgi:hypothetical protein
MRLDATIPMFALCLAASCTLKTPTLTAGASSLPSMPSASSGPPPAAEAATDGSQIIEAGCTFDGNDVKGEPGTVRLVSCPAGCDKNAAIWGTDVYAGGSPVCVAAIHAGMIAERGGEFTLVIEGGRPAFRGSKRNGVQSRDWSADRSSYRFEGPPRVVAAAPAAHAPVIIEAGCTFHGDEIHGEVGSIHRVSCPAGCVNDHERIWGSDPYTGDTPVCVAAIHAGLTSDQAGGMVTIIVDDGKPAYRGSKRNGLQSNDHDAHPTSFRFQR